MAADRIEHRQAFVFPALPAIKMLEVMNRIAEDDSGDALAAEPHFALGENGSVQLYLPSYKSAPHLGQSRVGNARKIIVDAYANAADVRDLGPATKQTSSINFSNLAPLFPVLVLIVAFNGSRTGDPLGSGGDNHLVLIVGNIDDQALGAAAVVRSGRDCALFSMVFGKGLVGATLVRVSDLKDDKGLTDTLFRVGSEKSGIRLLSPVYSGKFTLWLDYRRPQPDPDHLAQLGACLTALQSAGILKKNVFDIGVIQSVRDEGDGDVRPVIIAIEDLVSAPRSEDILGQVSPIQPIDIRVISFIGHNEATAALAKKISELKKPIGYEIELRPMRRGLGPDMDLSPLREQIDELEFLIQQAQALQYPQKRLLRFSDAQFPVMIDALRRLPQSAVQGNDLLYAASHNAGSVGPIHFLLYDPSIQSIYFPEVQGRSITDDQPMTYWIEPFVAEAQATRPAKTSVFVPYGMFLAPSPAHFASNIDGALRMIMGRKFEGAQKIVDNPKAEPMFLYAPSNEPGLKLVTEVIDGAKFAPLKVHLDWLNDYVDVRGPHELDRASLKQVADNIYQGDVARRLRDKTKGELSEISAEWTAGVGQVRTQAKTLLAGISLEIDDTSERVNLAFSYLKDAKRTMKGLDTLLVEAEEIMRSGGTVSTALSSLDEEMVRTRQLFADRVQSEKALAEIGIEVAQERIDGLLKRFEAVRNWRQQ